MPKLRVELVYVLLKSLLEVLNRVEIRGVGRPFQSVNTMRFQLLFDSLAGVNWRVVLHKYVAR